MTDCTFVTGASGFIGGAVARALVDSPHYAARVHAMSRSAQSDQMLTAMGVTPIRCELGSVRAEHLAGCTAIIHCAAFVKQWGTREQFWSANVTGTEQLLQVARKAGVKRFVHIGTEAALFHGQHMRDIDESYPYPRHRSPFLYSETKAAAEQRVLAANAPDFTTLSIRPRFVWGPGDQTVLPIMVQMVKEGRFMWIDGGRRRSSTTHIANLVHGIVLGLTHGRGGNAYFIADSGDIVLRDFITALMATRGVVPPEKSIPGALARLTATIIENTWRGLRLKSEPPLTRFAASMMSRDCTIRTDKAQRELQYQPVITRERGLAELRQSG